MQALINNNTAIYVSDATPANETRYRARFYFDPNSISMSSGNSFYMFYGYNAANTVLLRIEFRYASGTYQLRVNTLNDSGTWLSTTYINLSDSVHYVEIDWRASSAAGANNGVVTLWLDGVQRANLTGVDNDTRRIDRVSLGVVAGIDSRTRGTLFIDAFESRRQTYIGP